MPAKNSARVSLVAAFVAMWMTSGIAAGQTIPPTQAQCWNATVNRIGNPYTFPDMFIMNWASCASGNPSDTVSEAGDRLQGQPLKKLSANPNGAVLLHDYHWSQPVASATYAGLLARVPDSSADYEFFLALGKGLAARNAKPPLIVTDFEGNEAASWNWADATANIDRAARSISRTEYQSLAYAMQDAGFPGVPPLVAGSGIAPAAAPYIDPNGIAYLQCGSPGYSIGGVHSPMVYLSGGRAYAGSNLDPRWENFRGIVAEIEAGAMGANPPMPWIAYTTYRGDGQPAQKYATSVETFLQARIIMHARAAGATTLLYWNPTGRANGDDTAFYTALKQANLAVQSAATSIHPEPKGSPTVTTGSVTTTYAQFQQAVATDAKLGR